MRPLLGALALGCIGCAEHDYYGPEPELELGGSAYPDRALAIDDVDRDGRRDFFTRIGDASWAGETLGTAGRFASGRDGRTLATAEPPLRDAEPDWLLVLGDDVDGDDVADLVSASTRQCLSGSSGRALRELGARVESAPVEACGLVTDLNGDGAREIALGMPGHGGEQSASGRVELHSSRDGSLLAALDGRSAGERFGAPIEACGDIDGDGVTDLAVGAPGAPDGGIIRILSGRDLRMLRDLSRDALPTSDDVAEFGSSFAACGDADGDGTTEFAVARGESWTVVSIDRPTEFRVDVAEDEEVITWLGDWDRDGLREFVRRRNRWVQVGFDETEYARFEVVSLRTGAVLLSVGDDSSFGDAWNCGDFDGDGNDDLAVDVGSDKLLVYGSAHSR